MGMRYTSFVILSSIFIVSCGGGGGGGTSGILGGPSGGGGTTYTYKKVDERITEGSVSQYDRQGTAVALAYNQESGLWYRKFLELNESNISLSTGTNTNGEQYFQINIDKYLEETPEGWTTPHAYNLLYNFSFTGNQIFNLYYSPTHVYTDEYFSNAYLIAFGLSDHLQYAGTEYVDMLMWWMRYDSGVDDFVAFTYGDTTFSGDMPTTSSATFNIKSMGFWMSNYTKLAFTGAGSMTANFANMTLTGSLENNFVTDSFYDWSQIAGATAGGMNFDGTISGSDFSGSVTWGGEYGSGTFSGNFYGPKAKEIGGTFSAFAADDGYANWIMGSFIGAQ